MHEFLLNERCFIVRGEPEETISELFLAFEGKQKIENVLGVSWLKNGKIINNPPRPLIQDLDKLPFPARHLINNPDGYYNPKLKGRPTTTMLTSRGCYGRCIYCIPCAYSFSREIEYKKYHNFNKPPMRVRSPENIFEEFKLIKEMGYKSVAIMDDNFMGSKGHDKRIEKICELIKPLGIEWGCLARADDLQNEKVLRKMKEAGCVYVDIGVESFSKEVLDYVKKDATPGEQFNAILLLKKVGIEPKVNILLGASPLQTKEDIMWTLEVLKKLDVDFVSFSIVTPHPMTEYYRIIKENKWFANPSGDWVGVDPYREAEINLPSMSREELKEMVKKCYREYYLRPSYIWKRLKKIRSLREFIENIKTGIRLFT